MISIGKAGELLRLSLILLLAGLPRGGAMGAGLLDRYLINDGGLRRVFELALDEAQILAPEPRALRFARMESAEALLHHAEAIRQDRRAEVGLVLYAAGAPRHEFSRRILTRQVVAQLAAGADSAQVARDCHADSYQPLVELAGWYLFESREIAGAPALAERLRRHSAVSYAEVQLARRRQKKLIPNDTYFGQQWHLRNTGQNGGTAGIDINVTTVWDTWRGAGLVIGIVDDGLQLSHPDLAPNINTTIDWDFNFGDADPSPALPFDTHGTSVAGVAAGRGNNGLGITGVAYEATLVGLRLLGDIATDAQDAAAMLHSNAVIQVKNNSWGASDGGGWLEGAGPLMNAALAQGTRTGRGGKGTIYVFSGGNGLTDAEDVNYDGYANSIYAFAIGAVMDQGALAPYSEPGACLTLVAPSSDYAALCSGGRQGITTTELAGNDGYNPLYVQPGCETVGADYTSQFNGTSASTPVVSGVIALLLQSNPGLGYRDVKEILMRSARKVSATDSDWSTNSAGIAHNHKFGAGLVNAGAAIALGSNWANLGSLLLITQAQAGLNIPIPDDNSTGITRTFTVTNRNFRVEHVGLTLTVPHSFYGDLAVTLTSPGGVQSRLAERHSSEGSSYDNWTLMSVRHWGEQAIGTWTVKIADLAQFDTGNLTYLALTLQGTTPNATLSLARTNQNKLVTLRATAMDWRYALEGSTNLTSWTQLTTLAMPASGRSTYLDTDTTKSWRFYRARLLP